MNRRSFVTAMLASGIAKKLRSTTAAPFSELTAENKPVAEVFVDLNRIHKWDESNGDTWDPFWADDDQLYSFNCDGRGFGAKGKNLAFNRLYGDATSKLAGDQVNPMDEYGRGGQKGPDNATWKACGQECIDGVFYAFVSRNVYGSDSKDPLMRQLATHSSLIKSSDRGRTWMRTAQENYDKPMWPGPNFGAPFFVHYGRDGGDVVQDDGNVYVYAVSTNGFWNDGDRLILGRVRRTNLPRLNSSDWEYYAGLDGRGVPKWSREIGSATAILERAARCGQTPICYVPALDTYLLISWYNTPVLTQWFKPEEMHYDFYQAPHPWGPWSLIDSISDRFMGPGYHMYGPSLCARFQQKRGDNIEISMFTSGCPFEDVPATPYKLWHIPVLLRTRRLTGQLTIPTADPRIVYHGSWFPWTTVEESAGLALPRATQTKGNSAEFTFEGSGVEYVAQKNRGQGLVNVYLDGQLQSKANLDVPDFPVLFGVVVFSATRLPVGRHMIRIENEGNDRVNLECFRVFPA
jgi:hypothetical protein